MIWCRKLMLILVLAQATVSWSFPSLPNFCAKELGAPESEIVEKIKILQVAGQKFSTGLFQSEDVLANPDRFKSFVKQMRGVELDSIDAKTIDTLVDKYLAGVFEDYSGLIGSIKKRALYPAAPISVLSRHYSESLKAALQEMGHYKPKEKAKWKLFLEKKVKEIEATAFVASWFTIAMNTSMIAPVYIPGIRPKALTEHQKKVLAEKIPTLKPEEALALIRKEIPGINALTVYQTIRRTYIRLATSVFVGALLFSPTSINYLNQNSEIGWQMIDMKARFDMKWDQMFANKAEMQNQVMMIRASQEAIDLSDATAFEKLHKEVQVMTNAQLEAYLK